MKRADRRKCFRLESVPLIRVKPSLQVPDENFDGSWFDDTRDVNTSPLAPPVIDAADKDAHLDEDIRLLGRLLGEVIKDQAGRRVYDLVEEVRRLAVTARRAGTSDSQLVPVLDALDDDDAHHIVLAFSWFSFLANIAEDAHHARRRRFYAEQTTTMRPGTIDHALDELLAESGTCWDAIEVLERVLVSPVLTAHPTEVRRRTVLDNQRNIALLLGRRDHSRLSSNEQREWEDELRLAVLTLWQTAILRVRKLRVRDEIDESLAYYGLSLFDEVVALHERIERGVERRWPELPGWSTPTMLRMGSWIGGDRDGNPFVSADVLSYALLRQATVALARHLEALHRLAIELSMSDSLITPTTELVAIAEASADQSPFRIEEPYRRALRGMHARLAATAVDLVGQVPGIAPHATLPAYAKSADLVRDLVVVEASLRSHGAGALPTVESVRCGAPSNCLASIWPRSTFDKTVRSTRSLLRNCCAEQQWRRTTSRFRNPNELLCSARNCVLHDCSARLTSFVRNLVV